MKHTLFTLLILIPGMVFSQNSSIENTSKKYNRVQGLFIGISDYSELPDLNYADSDAQLMYELCNILFPDQIETMSLLVNDQASMFNIVSELKRIQIEVKEGDLVIIFFSGHSDVLSDDVKDSDYLLAFDASKSREYEAGGAINLDFVNKLIEIIGEDVHAETWLITDACRSGNVSNVSGEINTMRALNEDLQYTTKFVSCAPHEVSYEDNSLQNSFFTHYLAKGMTGAADSDLSGSISVDELDNYLKLSIRKATDNKQTPRISSKDDFIELIILNDEIIEYGSKFHNQTESISIQKSR